MSRLTNMYYSQYESSIESECAYDSDNLDTYTRLIQSPSQAGFRRYIEYRNDEELLHESWKCRLREQTNLAKEIKDLCGMAVQLKDNRVDYVYKPGNEIYIPGIKFRITFVYIKLLRKWYISLGRSLLPDVINLHNKIRKGTYDPTGPRVLEIIRKVKKVLEIFVQRLEYIHKMIDNAKEAYKDIEFHINKSFTNIKIVLKEKAWPKAIEKTSPNDIIFLDLIVDLNFETERFSYSYVHSFDVPADQKKMCISKLEKQLKIFFDLPLMDAFTMFMNEYNSLDETSPAS